MGEEVLTTPQTTLVILLGASKWPRWPDLGDSDAFANSANKVRTYFLDSRRFHLPRENLLDLFDSDASADAIDEAISKFLAVRTAALAAAHQAATDLVVYYIGHAGLVEENSEYYLAIRCTRESHPGVSGLRIDALARTITKSARDLRRLIILDCCYAANAFNAFQAQTSGAEEAALIQAWDAFKDPYSKSHAGAHYPRKGTALLCSSSRTKPSLFGPQGTEFTEALLHILHIGLASEQQKLSLRLITSLVREYLDVAESKAPRPEVHSPDQSEGDVAAVPFFPNFSFQKMQQHPAREVGQFRWPKEEIQPRARTQRPAPSAPRLPAASRQPPRRPYILVVLLCLVLLISGGVVTWLALPKTEKNAPQKPAVRKSAVSRSIQFGFDAAHTDWNPDEHLLNVTNVTHIRQLWSFTMGGSTASSPIVAGDMVYIGASDGKLYAFDATCRSNCQPLWTFATGNDIDSSPAVAGGMVYIGSGDGSLYAFDATCRHQCQSLWSYQTGSSIDSSPTVANAIVYVGSSDGKLYAFDATCRSNCQPLWSFNTGKSVNSSPAVAGGMVYIFSQNGNLYAFDATCHSNCQPLWSFPVVAGGITGGGFDSSPTVAHGMVYMAAFDGTVYAFDATCRYECQPLWSFQTGGAIDNSPAVAYGMVYIGSFNNTLYAFDATCRSSCQPLWSFTAGGPIVASPTIANGVVYVNSTDGHLYTFNAACHQSCHPLGSFPLVAGSADSTPAVANGMIYTTSGDLNFYALGLAT